MRLLRGLLAALIAGLLVTVGGLVAPTLFALLERPVAGRIAGELFRRTTWISFACALVLVLLPASARLRALAALPALLLAASEYGVRPELEAIRAAAGAGSPAFIAWHAASATLYLLATLAALGLLVAELRAPRGR
jgi:hypothetical protein